MADPSFNLKTGADSEIYLSPVVTTQGTDFGKVRTHVGLQEYPKLTRCTGSSIKGTQESIESNELRKGRTKSAPRKGAASSEGSLDIELSPETYDSIFEAVFRNTWKRWTSDTASEINLDGSTYAAGYFGTKCRGASGDVGTFGPRKLLNTDNIGTGDALGLIQVPSGSVVDELTCGTTDIKFDMLRKFGGVDGEDIYQRFKRMALSTFTLSVAVNAIVTGSFTFMGDNDPKMMDETAIKAEFGSDSTNFEDGSTTGTTYIDNLPKKSTSTDQFTAREGFMYINGTNIEFANSLDFSLNNGLEKKFAIFVPTAIAKTPLTLDITGTIKTYLISQNSDKLFNNAIDDTDNEILWCFQDKDEDPNYLYVFQIFTSKFTDHDATINGSDTLDVSFPYQSFAERAVRCFRITLPKASSVTATVSSNTYPGLDITPNVDVAAADVTGLTAVVTLDGVPVTMGTMSVDTTSGSSTYGHILYTFSSAISKTSAEQTLAIKVTLNGDSISSTVAIPASAST